MSKIVNPDVLQHALDHGKNILLRGKHGVGKTHIVLQALRDRGWNVAYFSASTMDPWVDMIGVPREVKDSEGNSYMDLLRPEGFQKDEYDAIVLDEFNRAPKKIRNALMELIQFRSINGRKFERIKCIIAMINPDDDVNLKYDVEAMDPAQLDRFQFVVDVPYALDGDYLRSKFDGPIASYFQRWWNGLDVKIKEKISPRRVEYAMTVYRDAKQDGVSDTVILNLFSTVLPPEANSQELLNGIGSGMFADQLNELVNASDADKIQFFLNSNNLKRFEDGVVSPIKAHKGKALVANPSRMVTDLLPFIPEETISTWINERVAADHIEELTGVRIPVVTDPDKRGWKIVKDAFNNHTHPTIVAMREQRDKLAVNIANTNTLVNPRYGAVPGLSPYFMWKPEGGVPSVPKESDLTTTPERTKAYESFVEKLPANVADIYGNKATTALFKALTHVLNSSNPVTLEKMPHLGGMIVHVGLSMRESGIPLPPFSEYIADKLVKHYQQDLKLLYTAV